MFLLCIGPFTERLELTSWRRASRELRHEGAKILYLHKVFLYKKMFEKNCYKNSSSKSLLHNCKLKSGRMWLQDMSHSKLGHKYMCNVWLLYFQYQLNSSNFKIKTKTKKAYLISGISATDSYTTEYFVQPWISRWLWYISGICRLATCIQICRWYANDQKCLCCCRHLNFKVNP